MMLGTDERGGEGRGGKEIGVGRHCEGTGTVKFRRADGQRHGGRHACGLVMLERLQTASENLASCSRMGEEATRRTLLRRCCREWGVKDESGCMHGVA